MDQMVLATQQWLNKTYGGINGFHKAPENGQTGWSTIYSLREGLQHELKLSELGEGFGDQTKAALAKVIDTIKKNTSSKIVKLIKGAFWCKGISPNSFTESYDEDLVAAIKSLQRDAGVDTDGNLTVNLMSALFDMSAFTLLENGDKRIREMQQALNKKYSNDLGILPCDGVYQRGTNTALIYALQRVEGIDATTANGNYGAETIARTPTVSEGTTGEIVQIIQYGLYVNGFYTGAFDGSFTETVGNAIVAFRKFMDLEPYTTTADLTVIKGLLTSNGNTDRDSIAFDTATRLTSGTVTKFKNAGFEIVGRYLTGTVGTGSNERPKNLTADEITAITSAGLRIFPIYEDGGYEEKYFTNSQGTIDGGIATAAARKLDFPEGTTIYFAVDVDIQDGDIDGTVIPYLKGVLAAVADSGYEVGVYGTRNVCLYAEKIGVKYSFVANMSYGWSGNLGFKMPLNWSFDQFKEYTAGSTGIDIDQDAASGKDQGCQLFEDSSSDGYKIVKLIPSILKSFPIFKNVFGKVDWLVAEKSVEERTPVADFKVEYSTSWSAGDEASLGVISVKNGKPVLEANSTLKKYFGTVKDLSENNISAVIDDLAPLIGDGNVKSGPTMLNGKLGIKTLIEGTIKKEISSVDTDLEYTITLSMAFNSNYPEQPIDPTPISAPIAEKKTFKIPSEGIAVWGLAVVAGFGVILLTKNPVWGEETIEVTSETLTTVGTTISAWITKFASISFD
ncbi:glycoside hydrolase domain-containing protein [Liquorilactobacillus capillatus]|uniref:Rv2525c-like glycoside hydrolase-like domain-containing protein n=2 Tax=Liquorilactobacillus capillatus TaxID=480931 RepID=A0A0R1M237_9LACO|nr:glycoside hydrolase domain-containing protein [Liquorilactobacillus capillatus]AJA33864.1 putative peptidoglycan binding domain protein [Liquorilactobacillus capillatus]KRL02076.1 hypothetical protein FC81_GL000839 [Liquorilactobacillus capillatus DSM 19910]